MKLYSPWMAAVFCSADRGRRLLLKELLKKTSGFWNAPIQGQRKGFFPKPTVLTLVLASQINLLWIPKFTEWQRGEGSWGVDGARKGRGWGGVVDECVPKKSVLLRCWFLIHCSSVRTETQRNARWKWQFSFRGRNAGFAYELKKSYPGGKIVTPRTQWKDSCCAGGSESRGALWNEPAAASHLHIKRVKALSRCLHQTLLCLPSGAKE